MCTPHIFEWKVGYVSVFEIVNNLAYFKAEFFWSANFNYGLKKIFSNIAFLCLVISSQSWSKQ